MGFDNYENELFDKWNHEHWDDATGQYVKDDGYEDEEEE